MRKTLVRTAGPASEPVTLDQALSWCRVSSDSTDTTDVSALIASARAEIENLTGLVLLAQTFRLVMSDWPAGGEITLDRAPVSAVASVKYYPAGGGAQATLSNTKYRVLTDASPGVITLNANEDWPDLDDRPDAVEVLFTAGHGSAAAIDPEVLFALRQLVTHGYDIRGRVITGTIVNAIPAGVDSILERHRIGGWMA